MSLTLYHGTKGSLLPQLKREGIKPLMPGDVGNWEHTVPSHPGHTYLTDTYPWYFAGHATRFGCWALVLEIELEDEDLQYLYPDEDYMAQAMHLAGVHTDIPLVELTTRIDLEAARECWSTSLERMGTCSYKRNSEPLPWSKVKRYALVKDWTFLCACAEALICVQNYTFCSEKYRGLLQLGFGDIDEYMEPHIQMAQELGMFPDIKPMSIDPSLRKVVSL